MLAAVKGLERRDNRGMIGALVLAACCAASHATGILILLAIVVYCAAIRRTRQTRVGIAIAVAVVSLGALAGWSGVLGTLVSDFAVPEVRAPLWKMFAAVAYNEGLLLCLAALVGAAMVLAARRGSEGVVVFVTVVPAALFFAGSSFAEVGPRFLASCEGGILILAVVAFDSGLGTQSKALRRGVALALAFVVISQIALVVANRTDDQRYDYHALSDFLQREAKSDALVFSTGHMVLDHYLGRPTEEYPQTIDDFERRLEGAAGREVFFVVLKQRGQYFMHDRALLPWLWQRAQRVETFGRRRPDDFAYHFEIDLFRWVGAR
jgi:hypothetical protein